MGTELVTLLVFIKVILDYPHFAYREIEINCKTDEDALTCFYWNEPSIVGRVAGAGQNTPEIRCAIYGVNGSSVSGSTIAGQSSIAAVGSVY